MSDSTMLYERSEAPWKCGAELLDELEPMLSRTATVEEGMDRLLDGLADLRSCWSHEVWNEFCSTVCPSHPLATLVHQDPFTRRAFEKPRGYAGDAVLIDYLYRHPSVSESIGNASPVGRAIMDYKVACPSGDSVRWRRERLADLIDETADAVHGPRILSVACGHLREAQLSHAVASGAVAELVALDQDRASLATVEREQSGRGVSSVPAPIRDLVAGKLDLGQFDLIYSAGLYDYLSPHAAATLTRTLYGMLQNHGRLVIANFLTGNRECGYMEAFMHWNLRYRTEVEFLDLTPELEGCARRSQRDALGYVIYVELSRLL